MIILSLTVAVAVAACAWLVPSMGLMGAAHALQLSVAVQWIGATFLLWKAGSEIAATPADDSGLATSRENYVAAIRN